MSYFFGYVCVYVCSHVLKIWVLWQCVTCVELCNHKLEWRHRPVLTAEAFLLDVPHFVTQFHHWSALHLCHFVSSCMLSKSNCTVGKLSMLVLFSQCNSWESQKELAYIARLLVLSGLLSSNGSVVWEYQSYFTIHPQMVINLFLVYRHLKVHCIFFCKVFFK